MSAAGAGGAHPSPPSPPPEADALVVGGGVAGLTAAWELARAGLRPLLVEARGYTGGLIAGGEIGGVPMDLGAESVVLRGGAVTTMLDALGLETTAHRGRPSLFLPPMAGAGPAVTGAGVPSSGGWALHPFPREAILGIPADPLSDDAIALLGEAGARRAARDGELAAGIGTSPSDPRDLASLVRARMGEAVLDRLVRPIVAGIHANDPAVLDADVVVPGLRADVIRLGSLQAAIRARLEKRRSRPAGQRGEVCVVGGMHRFTAALRAAIEFAGGTVLTRWGARGMRPEDGPGGHGPWRVALTPTGRGATPSDEPIAVGAPREVRARRVVLACSAHAALRLLTGAPGLAPDTLDIAIPSGAPIARLTIVARAPGLAEAPVGSGLLVAPAPPSSAPCPVAAKALSHLDAKWPWIAEGLRDQHGEGTAALRLSYGRPGGPRPEPALADALDDIAALTGVRIDLDDVLDHRLVRWDGTLPPAMPDYRQRTARLEEAVASLPCLSVTGAWVAGTGIAAVVAHACERAAEMVGPPGARNAEPGGTEED
ncbi:protoporphyrinogen/coproporphyrinogen oxidase [Actinomyces gaoshouyii]|uniref:protoporphyrinogen/coproporphyrinogen oxidase n=1 Tax=Actinomyces gaoshouyii TaxID=1960083 RepID=UPI0009BD2B4D|nr:FAD-dependent oxidoreductase [Actinomyces gaoshouyii]ARD42557.1 protoporphyrinogen oxidase [Actinomyces gaoshouyii]